MLSWHREGYSHWIEPETWIYTTEKFGGKVYAKVVWDAGGLRKWVWQTQQAVSNGFASREEAQAQAEGYVRTHPQLRAMNDRPKPGDADVDP